MTSDSNPHGDQPVARTGAAAEDATAAVVLVHGRGATAEDILSLSRFVERDDVVWLAPQAGSYTWYPHSFLAPLSQNEPWLSSALQRLGSLIDELGEQGIATQKVVVAGFSQGACLATEFVARHAQRFGGLVAFSGGLIGSSDGDGQPPHDKAFEYDGSLDDTPVFIGCSDVDPHIPVERVNDTARVLAELGGDVTKKIYPGMGHTISDDEVRYFQNIVSSL